MNVRYLLEMVLVGLMIISCSDMNSMHQEYLDRGESIYAKKVDSVNVFSGTYRVNLEIFLDTFSIKKLVVKGTEGSGIDTQFINIGHRIVDNKIDLLIERMPEGDNFLSIYSYDLYGNSSLPVEKLAKCYGDFYRESLQDRIISSQKNNEGLYELKFFPSTEESLIETKIEFTKNDETAAVVTVGADDVNVIVLSDIDIGKECKYRSKFLPEASAIDTIYSKYTVIDPSLW
ncbi:MAG: DUF4998 domain-containing protein [Bacteroidales bacterium]